MSIVLQGSTSGSITLQEPAVAGSNTINLPAATGTAVLTGVSGTVDINAAGSNNVTLSTNSTERVRVDSSGNVGIGTSELTFDTGSGLRIQRANAPATIRLAQTGTGNSGFEISAANSNAQLDYRTNSLLFLSAGTERMRITSGGQLYVGATSTVFTNDTTGGSFQGNQTGGGKPILEVVNNNNTSSSDGCPAIIAAKGSSTTSSSARFIQFSASGAAQPMGGIVGNGATNCQFASISDAREKTNIQEISGSLEKINLLKPVEFDWIRDSSHVNAGFVAQDVQQVFPEFVVENMSDEGQEQRYGLTGGMTGGIIAHLVKAIQELKGIVDTQATKIAELEAKLEGTA